MVGSAERKETQEKLVTSLLQGQPQPFFFPEGLLGFSACQRFTLGRYQPSDGSESPFFLLQAIDSDLSFPLVSPRLLVVDYQFSPSAETLIRLATDTLDDLVVLAIVTLRQRLEEITANLALFQLRYVISHRARRFQFEVSITEMMASALLPPVFDENHFIGPKIAEKLSSYQRLSSKESATENNRFRDASSFLVNLPHVGVSAASAELH